MGREDLADWLRLALTPGIGNATGRKLLAAFGLPSQVFTQSRDALLQVVTDAQAHALQQLPRDFEEQIRWTLDWLQGTGADGATRRIVTLGDPGYPASLLETADPPLMLYLLGAPSFDLTQLDRSIAMVGSRNPTAQGEQTARAFARAFGEAGIAVVSGLALGIDGAAHNGALEAGGGADRLATVAVVGTGLDRVYPARHRELAHRIAGRGLIVSEYPLGTPPLNQNFPQRNRIIAGLSRGTLVVEAALRSGSLITARLAAEQGREVFAIPGSIHSPQSRGCHALIRQGAKLVESVGDVLEELRFDTPASADARIEQTEAATTDESGLLADLSFDPVSLDSLCARTGYGAAELQARLLELELEGRVARLPGGLFQRVARG
ncbi:DNA-processing protein DprA [Variovorax sp. Sphag1AA]|uniref:DNA-processing protein DprA n=1 Tax=Variovorax sp. Sphag1AA TaxID=2587027 RepID=UPI001610CB37|nr:DNA-processing protein DprA [Variovorax sp. Sphag1AA]MBB3180570.1 DNA processing protein [Variovorax sp. Sphag1AA]